MFHRVLMLCGFMLLGVGCQAQPRPAGTLWNPQEMVVCGNGEVSVILATDQVDDLPQTAWVCRVVDAPSLPRELRPRLVGIDECKPVDGGRRILLTSSTRAWGAAAVVERPSGRVIFYARNEGAHSIELLPDNRVVVACAEAPNGHQLIVYDLDRSDVPVFSLPLHSAHGVYWDAERQLLWAIGGRDLKAYTLHDWDTATPSLQEQQSHPLPDQDGHDLVPVPGTSQLALSTDAHCWLFDRQRKQFEPMPELADKNSVKSISFNPLTGRMAWTQYKGNGKMDLVNLTNPPARMYVLDFPYKVRWNVDPTASTRESLAH